MLRTGHSSRKEKEGEQETDEDSKRRGKEKNNETGKGKRQKDRKRQRNDKWNNERDRMSHCPFMVSPPSLPYCNYWNQDGHSNSPSVSMCMYA